VGRAISWTPNPTGAPPSEIDYIDSNGATQKILIATTNVSLATNLPCGGDLRCTQATGYIAMPSQITLPNGLKYAFTYPNTTYQYGEISSATLPTGAQIAYTWQMSGDTNTQVTSRTVTANGQNFVWNYNYGNPVNGVTPTTVTDPALNDTRYSCGFPSGGSGGGNPALLDMGTYGCEISKVEYFSGSASTGTLLKTVTTDYGGTSQTALPIRETTTWAQTNQVTKVETDWDSFDTGQRVITWRNPTNTREYAYGNGSPGGLVRTTHFDYLHQTNTSYRNANIADKETDKIVYEADGVTVHAKTLYTYDNTTLTATSGVVSHDYTHFSTSNLLRGNSTQIQNWRNTDNTFLSTYNYYNDAGDLVQVTDPKGNITKFDYTDSWYQNTCAPASGSALAFVTKTTNALNQITTVKHDSCSSLIGSMTDLNGQITTYAYDSMGRRTQTNNADGGQTSVSYGATLPLTIVSTAKITSSLNKITTSVQDDLGQMKQSQLNSDPDGVACVDITHDAFGRKLAATNPYRSSSCSGSAILTSYAYDALGRVIKVTEPDGSIRTTNFVGSCTTVTDEAGKIRRSCTDSLGRLVQVFEPDSSNGLTNETDYQYDVADNLVSVQQKGNDSNSAHWRTRTSTYDSLSELTSIINPEVAPTGGSPCTVTYTYDSDGNVATKIAPIPNQSNCSTTVTTTFANDPLARVTSRSFSNGDPTITYAYDGNPPTGCSTGVSSYGLAIGRRTAMCDGAGAEAWIYADILNQGRQIADQRTTNGVMKTTVYHDTLDGSLYSVNYPSGRVVTYTPGGAGKTLSATDSSTNYATNAHYAPHGGLSSLTIGANFLGTYIYNQQLQPCWIYVTTGTALSANTACTATDSTPGNILDLQYSFNLGAGDNGNVIGITNNRDSTRSQTYSYDQLNRLSTAQTISTASTSLGHCWGEIFNYDQWANYLSVGVVSTSYNGCTQESLSIAITPQNQISGDTYDAAGNRTASGAATYTYNALGQLTATAGNTYLYDGDGKRVEKATSGQPLQPYKLYWYGMNSDPLDETDASGSVANSSFNEFVFFEAKRIARRDSSGNLLYYFGDHLGTSRVNVQAGQTAPCYDADFYPYGVERAPYINTCSQNYKYTGKERDTESNLDNFGKRYNAPSMGRFMTPDPVKLSPGRMRDPQQLNLFAYARNNPMRFLDPDGQTLLATGKISDITDSICKILGGDCSGRVQFDPKTNTVTVDLTGINLSQNGGASLLSNVTTSPTVYSVTLGSTMQTAGGTVPISDIAKNLDNNPDSRYSNGKKPTDRPAKGIDDQIGINPSLANVNDSHGKPIPLYLLVFHELAEAYAKVDEGRDFNDFEFLQITESGMVRLGAGVGAHNVARAREMELRQQRPDKMKDQGFAGDEKPFTRDPIP
jgi:RHS repeat-associated protein